MKTASMLWGHECHFWQCFPHDQDRGKDKDINPRARRPPLRSGQQKAAKNSSGRDRSLPNSVGRRTRQARESRWATARGPMAGAVMTCFVTSTLSDLRSLIGELVAEVSEHNYAEHGGGPMGARR